MENKVKRQNRKKGKQIKPEGNTEAEKEKELKKRRVKRVRPQLVMVHQPKLFQPIQPSFRIARRRRLNAILVTYLSGIRFCFRKRTNVVLSPSVFSQQGEQYDNAFRKRFSYTAPSLRISPGAYSTLLYSFAVFLLHLARYLRALLVLPSFYPPSPCITESLGALSFLFIDSNSGANDDKRFAFIFQPNPFHPTEPNSCLTWFSFAHPRVAVDNYGYDTLEVRDIRQEIYRCNILRDLWFWGRRTESDRTTGMCSRRVQWKQRCLLYLVIKSFKSSMREGQKGSVEQKGKRRTTK